MPRPKKPLRRKTPFRTASMLAKVRPLRRVSGKRAEEMRLYSKLRADFLQRNPVCAVWMAQKGWERGCGPIDYVKRISMTQIQGATEFDLLELGAPQSEEIHHREGRGPNFLRTETWLAVSAQNHRRIHRNPSWARAHGFLK